jgi:putative flippase GtrA
MTAAARAIVGEGARYLAVSAFALAVDFGLYAGLIRLAGVHYLLAAPIGFLAGLAVSYVLSVKWAFRNRRLADPRMEFAIFAALGLAGVILNQLIIYGAVEGLKFSFELAKLASAAFVFCFNFSSRKLLLFTLW